MLKFMKKIPGGLLLIPMLISALFATFLPDIFKIGGMTEAFFTTKGINYIVGLICFCSSASLDFEKIKKVMRKQGSILLVKIILCFAFSFLFFRVFGMKGFWGISAIAFTTTICSLNPSLYLALVSDYGTESDESAFGVTGLLCVPAFPMLVYSVSKASNVDWMPVISVLIPIVIGILIGNLDKELGKFFSGAVPILTPFMGWAFGAGINLISAFKAGLEGVILTIIFYVICFPLIWLFETKVLKEDGITTFAISSIAGLSVSVPTLIAATDPNVADIASVAVAQIAFGVVLTSIITPILTDRYAKKHNIQKRTLNM
ncbi:MAG: 2-keto-3-deoxygluconate permease [Ezakiella sp.]|nr:2-keto-3-deoxygluconate permease [Ezakiella sp.]MDD7472253.1 2-keto-3-deoxygluconate permease [Bacillota bacterium]